jgi:hypothetical protein
VASPLNQNPPASVQTFTERITIPYTSTTTQTLAPSTYVSTVYKTLPASSSTIISSYTAAASTVYQSTTITSNFVTTLTSTIAPSTITSYEISTAPGKTDRSPDLPPRLTKETGATITSYSTIEAGPASTITITSTQPEATFVSTSYVTTPITSVSIYTQVCRADRLRMLEILTEMSSRLPVPYTRLRPLSKHIGQRSQRLNTRLSCPGLPNTALSPLLRAQFSKLLR